MAGSTATPGRWSLSQARHWASAWGWLATRRTSASAVPGAAARTKVTGTRCSATMTSGGVLPLRASRVALTPPSSEFSMGTTAASTSPERTASKHRPTVASGTRSAAAPASPREARTPARAVSVKVPAGPR